MPDWLRGEFLFVLLFIILPGLQKLFSWLAGRRGKAIAKERMRRRRDGTESPLAADESAGVAEAEPAEGNIWSELLEVVGAEEPVEKSFVVEPEEEPETLVPIPVIVPTATPAPAAPALATGFDELETRLGSASEVDDLTVALPDLPGLQRKHTADHLPGLSVFDQHTSDDGLSVFEPLSERTEASPGREPRTRRQGALFSSTDWRRAMVLSEILAPPVSMREPGGRAPGLES